MARKKITDLQVVDGRTIIDNIQSPVRLRELPPQLTDEVNLIVCGPLTDSDAKKVSEYASAFSNVSVTIAWEWQDECSLEFLRYFPSLHALGFMDHAVADADELKHIPPGLLELNLGGGRMQSLSLEFLEQLPKLRQLQLMGQSKHIESVSRLKHLQELTLYSTTLPDLSLLLPLKQLRSLNIRLGGTSNLDLVPRIGRLRYLELWRVKGVTDLSWLAEIRSLQYLWLQTLTQVKSLPSLKPLRKLRRVHLEGLKALTDLSSVAAAPNLEDLVVQDMRQLSPEELQPFVGHRKLRHANISLNSKKKNAIVEDMLPFPLVEYPFQFS